MCAISGFWDRGFDGVGSVSVCFLYSVCISWFSSIRVSLNHPAVSKFCIFVQLQLHFPFKLHWGLLWTLLKIPLSLVNIAHLSCFSWEFCLTWSGSVPQFARTAPSWAFASLQLWISTLFFKNYVYIINGRIHTTQHTCVGHRTAL